MFNELIDDLRFPIGLLFSIFSAILTTLGLTRPLPPGADVNLNLFAGGVMGVFGLFMLAFSVWSARAALQARKNGK